MEKQFPWEIELPKWKAALWFLGQAGYYMKSGGVSLVIDPYLSDSCGMNSPAFTRKYPVPVSAFEIKADIFIVTHDHTDHLDPETVKMYSYKKETTFVAPRFAARKLLSFGVPEANIRIVDVGESANIRGVNIRGVFALPTGADVLDTTGYLITFPNERSVYHTADTAFCSLLLKACPKAEVLLPCINAKFGNLNIAEAVSLTKAVNPKYVIPNHYDVMALNGENPESFKYFMEAEKTETQCVILKAMEMFVW